MKWANILSFPVRCLAYFKFCQGTKLAIDHGYSKFIIAMNLGALAFFGYFNGFLFWRFLKADIIRNYNEEKDRIDKFSTEKRN